MDMVVCKCAGCDAVLGSLANLWLQLGKKYITPLTHAQGDEPFPVATSGLVRLGDADTLVGGCQLQDAQCAKCRVNLGQKCLKSPVNHILSDGQIIFRITSVTLKLAADLRRKAEPNIKRVLQLKNRAPSASEHQEGSPSQTDSAHPEAAAPQHGPAADSLDLMQMQAELDAQRQHINSIGTSGMQVVSNFETVISRVDRQMQQLTESIDSIRNDRDEQRKDLGALKSEIVDARWDCQNSNVIARLDQQHQTTDRVVTELRQALQHSKSETEDLRDLLRDMEQEIQILKGDVTTLNVHIDETKQTSVAASRECAGEVSSLRREVKQLRAELAHERAQPQPAEPSSYSSHELDILASSISKIGSRASQVESLQMDFELFRTRLQRLEARANTNRAGGTLTIEATARGEDDNNDEAPPVYEGNGRRKRALTARDESQKLDKTPHKRAALSPSVLDSGVSTGCSRASDLFGSSPNGRGTATRAGPRRTRASAGDYGTAHRESWAGRG